MDLIDILCVNRLEASAIAELPVENVESAKAVALMIRAMGPRRVIVTLGSQGCVFTTDNGLAEQVQVSPVKVVDSTGAGDCFCGSLAYFLAVSRRRHLRSPCNDSDIRSAITKAATIASLSVTRRGAQTSYWTRDELLQTNADLFT